MKTKIFGGIAILAIALAVAFNVSVSNQKQDAASLLALANVEALAGENGEKNSFWDFWTQGLYKDEIVEETYCYVKGVVEVDTPSAKLDINATVVVGGVPVGGNVDLGSGSTHSEYQIEYTGTKISCSKGGTENCTPKECYE